MTGSWDNTLKFWDTRSNNPMMVITLPERVYCADVVYPMAIIGTAQRGIICYQLENQPSEYKRIDSPLKYQVCNLNDLSVQKRCKYYNILVLARNVTDNEGIRFSFKQQPFLLFLFNFVHQRNKSSRLERGIVLLP